MYVQGKYAWVCHEAGGVQGGCTRPNDTGAICKDYREERSLQESAAVVPGCSEREPVH